jgi:hypothetical protein
MKPKIDVPAKVAYRLGDFPLRVALRCVVLSYIEFIIDERFLHLADATLQPFT